jgi:hypothetical protein
MVAEKVVPLVERSVAMMAEMSAWKSVEQRAVNSVD